MLVASPDGWARPLFDVIAVVSDQLRHEGARGALIIGSRARHTATEVSDLDLLVVDRDESERERFERTLYSGVLVETAARDEQHWYEHLHGPRPRWVYAFMDAGDVLFDDGALARLQSLSRGVYEDFVTPTEVRQELASLLWHGRAKTARAAASQDPRQAAYWTALLVPTLLDALLALGNRPTVPGSRRLEVLETISLDPRDETLLTIAMTGEPLGALDAARELADSLLDRVGDPDLERVDW